MIRTRVAHESQHRPQPLQPLHTHTGPRGVSWPLGTTNHGSLGASVGVPWPRGWRGFVRPAAATRGAPLVNAGKCVWLRDRPPDSNHRPLIRVQLPLRCVPEPWAVWSSGTGCHSCCSLFLSLGTPLGGQPTWACHIRTACVSGAMAFALWALVLTRARAHPQQGCDGLLGGQRGPSHTAMILYRASSERKVFGNMDHSIKGRLGPTLNTLH